MIAVQTIGAGLTGCVRYVMGQGRDPDTKRNRPAAANDDESRVAWVSSQGFGEWTAQSRADIDAMRKVMEFAAQRQASKTRPCKDDCFHLVLSWRTGETPSRAEMEQAAKEALKAIGMETARAVFVAHDDTKHAHLHIVASRINPETGRAFERWYSQNKLQKWAHEWELRHGLVQCPQREKCDQLYEAIKGKNAAAVLDLMTQRQSTFTGKELDRELCGVLGREEAATFRADLLAQADIIPLHDRESGQALDRYTTHGVRKSERAALTHAAALAAGQRHRVSKTAATKALAHCPTIREEQRRAFDHAIRGAGLAIIDGKAGTGKSYTMNAIRAAYEGDGRRVIGLAPTNAVAESLKGDGFSDARTVHSALFALKNGRDRLDTKTVLMVDEAAMIGTKIMGELLARVREAGAKLVLVGDDRQLASIERGGLFTELRERFGAATLAEVTRQKNADHKAAAEMLSRGEFAEAVDALDRLGCINRSNHQTEARAALVAQWKADTAKDPNKKRLVFAYTNDDVQQLNAELRAVRKARGELGEDHALTTKDGKQNFAANDKILFRTTDKKKGITNGAVGTIEKIDGTKITMRFDENKKRLTFDAAEVQAFRHAYAATIYKGQGRTLDEVYLYHTRHWKAAASYVALTRHRDDVKLFVSTELTRDTADLARQLAQHDDRRASLAYATKEEAQEQRRDQQQRTAAEMAAPKAEPIRATDGATQDADARKFEEYNQKLEAEMTARGVPETAFKSLGSMFERLTQKVMAKAANAPTPVRPSDRAREVRGAIPTEPTAHPAPPPDRTTGQKANPASRHSEEVEQPKAEEAKGPKPTKNVHRSQDCATVDNYKGLSCSITLQKSDVLPLQPNTLKGGRNHGYEHYDIGSDDKREPYSDGARDGSHYEKIWTNSYAGIRENDSGQQRTSSQDSRKVSKMSECVWIDKEQAKRIHDHEISVTGGSFGLRDEGLLESAIDKPRNLYAYGNPDIFELAAAYAEGISQNHSFIDGNKRTAYQVGNVFLESNGHMLRPEADNEYYDTFVKLASGNLSSEELANFYRKNSLPLEQSQTLAPTDQTPSNTKGGETVPVSLLSAMIATSAGSEIIEGTAATIRETVGGKADTPTPKATPEATPPQTKEPRQDAAEVKSKAEETSPKDADTPREENQYERAERRIAELKAAQKAENSNAPEHGKGRGRSRGNSC